jgi:hypothetical protein
MEYEAIEALDGEARMGLVVALSEGTINLLSALLGAVVGGALTLTGSIVVSRWSRASEARMRMYDELIPQAMGSLYRLEVEPHAPDAGDHVGALSDTLHALRRASVVAGRPERRAADSIIRAWYEASGEGSLLLQQPGGISEPADSFRRIRPSLEGLMRILERRLD